MNCKMLVIGNVGRDPESKAAGQRTVVEFSVAQNFRQDDEPMWVRVTCWPEWMQDKVLTHVRKGQRVTVFGSFRRREYTNSAGQQGVAYEISADVVEPHSYQDDDGGAVSDSDFPF